MPTEETSLVQVSDLEQYFTDVSHEGLKEEKTDLDTPKKDYKGDGKPPIKWLSIQDGEQFLLRFLPPSARDGEWANKPHIRIFQHWGIGPSGDKRAICPKKAGHGECHICEQVHQLFLQKQEIVGRIKLPDEIIADLILEDGTVVPKAQAIEAKKLETKARKIMAKEGYIYQVLDMNNPFYHKWDEEVKEGKAKEGDVKIHFFRVSPTFHSDLLGFFSDPMYGQITNPLKGYNFVVTRTGSGFNNTSYDAKIQMIPSDDGPKMNRGPIFSLESGEADLALIKKVLETMHRLDQHPFFRETSYDEGLALWEGRDPKEVRNNQQAQGQHQQASASNSVSPSLPLDARLAEWKNAVKGGQVFTVEQLADWGGWDVADIKEMAPCYSNEPDHKADACWDCQLRNHCVASFQAKDGRSSINEEKPAVEKKRFGKGFGKGAASNAQQAAPKTASKSTQVMMEDEDDDMSSVDDMVSRLEAAASK